jgi:catalase
MDGFGIHTFRFVTSDGNSKFVKFHFKTKQGKASLVWEEAQVLAGKNADYHRDDLWEAIESGNGPEWEFGVQIFEEKDAANFPFDVLDPVSCTCKLAGPCIDQRNLDKNHSRGAGPRYTARIVEVGPKPTKLLR